MALNPAPFGRWTLRDKAAQRRLALRYASYITLLPFSQMKLSLLSILLGLGYLLSPLQVQAELPSDLTVCSTKDLSQTRSEFFSRAPLSSVEACSNAADPVAKNELGRRYGLGKGVTLDSRKSFDFYQAAANAGYPQAQANLAYMHFNGEGTPKDYQKAYDWALLAAKAGDPAGQYQVGYMHVFGLGVSKDGTLAEKWLLAAANQGLVQAQGALAEFYSDGKLLSPDPVKAVQWLHRERDAKLYGRIWREEVDAEVKITELPPEYAPRLAEETVKVVQNLEGKHLDYSPDSLHTIDNMITRFRSKGDKPESMDKTVIFFGCYVGEVFARNLGFFWVMPDKKVTVAGHRYAVLRTANETFLDPIEMVRNFLRNAEAGSLTQHYEVTTQSFVATKLPDTAKE